jgi:hypothetical protein
MNELITDKIVSIIKSCLDEWRKRREERANLTSQKPKQDVSIVDSEVETPETFEANRATQEPQSRQQTLDTPSSVRSMSPMNSPVQSVFLPRRPPVSNNDNFIPNLQSPYVQYHAENTNSTFINPQFLPEIYLASNGLSFNHGNTISLVPSPSPYEPLTALLNSDMSPSVHQAATSQIRVTSAARNGTRPQTNGTRQQQEDEEEAVTGYTYNPSERIEKMFGISPPWR